MKEKTKTEQINLEPEEEEQYLSYTIEKFVIIVKDNAVVNITNLMSGKPKDGPP